jgi:hypothetical protein
MLMQFPNEGEFFRQKKAVEAVTNTIGWWALSFASSIDSQSRVG